jgi:hypothetical protein
VHPLTEKENAVMSIRKLDRRAVLAGAAAVPALPSIAAALVSPAGAVPVADDVSFPDLVARFVLLRERMRAYDAKEKAHDEKLDKLFREATGLSIEEYFDLDRSDPRRKRLSAVHSKIIKENPDDDPVDANGSSIELDEICDEKWPLVEAMLSQAPRSFIDLAWQAEALVVADSELREGEDIPDGRMVRQLIKNIFALPGLSSIQPTSVRS